METCFEMFNLFVLTNLNKYFGKKYKDKMC